MLYQTFHAMTHAISEINIGRFRSFVFILFCFYFDFAKGLAKAKCGGV